ncbi:MAG: Wss1p-related putative metallopeptidase [Acidobacteriota bacterium]
MRRLRRDGRRIARQFGLPETAIRAERAGVNGHYGICYRDGRIHIRLRHATSGRLLRYSSLVNTLCHELAHLRHFNHGEEFKAFYFRLLRWAREKAIYQPRHAASSPPSVPPAGTRRVPAAARPRVAETVEAARTAHAPDTSRPPAIQTPSQAPRQLDLFASPSAPRPGRSATARRASRTVRGGMPGAGSHPHGHATASPTPLETPAR